MTKPFSRYQASGQQLGGPACLPRVPKLIAAVPGTQESQLLVPPGPLEPLTPPQWDEDQQLGGLKESLSQLCGLLLDKEGPPEAPTETADLGPMGKADSRSLPTPWGLAVPPTGGGGGVRAQPCRAPLSSLPNTALPLEAPDPRAPVLSLICPLRRKLWQSKETQRMYVHLCVRVSASYVRVHA